MPLFDSASGFQINGGSFLDITGDVNLHTTQLMIGHGSDSLTGLEFGLPEGLDRQLLGVGRNSRQGGALRMSPYAGDAFHDSAERYPQPKCHPETRTKLLGNLWNWTDGSYSFDNIAYEDDDWHHEEHSDHSESEYLQRSKEGSDIAPKDEHSENKYGDENEEDENEYREGNEEDDSNNENNDEHWEDKVEVDLKILWLHGPAGAGKSAIMQSLCQKLQDVGSLGGAFFFKRGHPSRGNGNKLFPTIAYQLSLCFPELNHAISRIVEEDPSIIHRSLSIQLKRLIIEPCRQALYGRTLTVIIDGLDECDGQNIQQEVLSSIGHSAGEDQLPLRFIVASSPEPHIREVFTDALHGVHCPVNIDQSFADVRKYLIDEFARIHHQHRTTMAMVPVPWPSLDIIKNLVEKSSGYFIYASTIIKFIDDKNFRPTKCLEVIVGIKESGFESPFVALDQLYTQILSEAPDRARVLKILAVIAVKLSLSADHIDQLLELEPGDVRLALRALHSVVNVPEQGDLFSTTLSIHHASFSDFLQDARRAGEFHVSSGQHQTELSCHILKAFSYKHDDASLNRSGHVAW
ncbi:hypothetical protein B0H19DRAFT_1267659 [Mycena capillaripes]|nr:hypothetical protein B0H19DRAFT_1267659 [Mycena capillaripes]